jgi:hypothetical protein
MNMMPAAAPTNSRRLMGEESVMDTVSLLGEIISKRSADQPGRFHYHRRESAFIGG